jgi:hypothetical protein
MRLPNLSAGVIRTTSTAGASEPERQKLLPSQAVCGMACGAKHSCPAGCQCDTNTNVCKTIVLF